MRVISGSLKGKRISLPKDKKTRPLKDIVKESIFNIIQHSNKINLEINNSNVLDLFSGSGSFGIECISRGAKSVIFNENYRNSIEILEKNISDLDIKDKCKIIKKDFFKLSNNLNYSFNIIFADPPFKETKINILIEYIYDNKMLKKDGILILHRNKKVFENLSQKLNIIEARNYGLSKIIFAN